MLRLSFRRVALSLLLITAGACVSASPPPESAEAPAASLRSLVEAERAFARSSREAGVRSAFLTHLDEAGVIFRPGPVNGREFMQSQPERGGTLDWAPRFAEVAAAGDFGYTTGPWTFRGPDASRPPAHGYYLSVWERKPGAPWRVVLDIGTVNPAPAAPIEEWNEAHPPPELWGFAAGSGTEAGLQRQALEEREGALGISADERVIAGRFFAPDAVLLRNGRQPAVGQGAVTEMLAAEPDGVRWQLDGVEVASSADLAYARGTYTRPAEGDDGVVEGYFVRLWRRLPAGEWRVAVELLYPTPPAPPAPPAGTSSSA